ncbi:DUF5690 family protein [uncultured Polaribacter sp.]|uniref:DUF5690 family protein n=1 Tax=uncultured Polaribacter sp. TaxID=174711 RepID=UPI0026069F90|nr:DUF5690 family protein [uncultured Polaribacter sp.]
MKFEIPSIINKKWSQSFWLMFAAFLCYTGMYAVRKSFLAGQYIDLDIGFNADPKTVLVISQVLGYMLSKFIGIKMISEMNRNARTKWILALVSFGLFMLLVFAILPPKLKIIALFLNGLPLGMVFGIVLSYLEGRRNTELLAAALSATFIFSTGLVKTVGIILMQDYGIGEYAMPFATGLLFFPVFILSVWILNRSKNPDALDVVERTERTPMNAEKRKDFLRKHGLGYVGLVLIYIFLTIVRDFRDNFIVEFWSELGYSGAPELITLTEIPVAIIVLVVAALGILIRKNIRAFNYGMWLTLGSAITMLIATFLFEKTLISPIIWIVSTGIGIYLPYILFHCLLFERLIALLKYTGNIGFLFYTADALGYLGSVAVLFLKEFMDYKGTWTSFFISLNFTSAILIIIFTLFSILYFNRKISSNTLKQVITQ